MGYAPAVTSAAAAFAVDKCLSSSLPDGSHSNANELSHDSTESSKTTNSLSSISGAGMPGFDMLGLVRRLAHETSR